MSEKHPVSQQGFSPQQGNRTDGDAEKERRGDRGAAFDRSADFPVCRIAGFPTCWAWDNSSALGNSPSLLTGKSAIRQTGKSAPRRMFTYAHFAVVDIRTAIG